MFRDQNSIAEQHSVRANTSMSSQPEQSRKEPKRRRKDLQIVTVAPSVHRPFPWLRVQPTFEELPSLEERAVSLFFSNFVLATCNHGFTQGYLVDLPIRYVCAHEGSILRTAVEACSLALYGRASQDREIELRAEYTNGQALNLLKEATANPAVFAEDDTLMAVLVLDFHQVSLASESELTRGIES
jgi:hypothetical protein